MIQHFLLSAAARTLSLAQVMRLSEREAEGLFRRVRWSESKGEPVCPSCGSLRAYEARRANGSARWRCRQKECRKDFTVTSGTLFAFHNMPLRMYLAAIAIFANEVKSMLALSRDLGVRYKTAFVLAHKVREAMAADMKAA